MSNPHNPINVSYDLEKHLSESIDKMRDNIERSHKLRKELLKVRRQRRQIEAVPEDVKEWFEETGEYLEEEE